MELSSKIWIIYYYSAIYIAPREFCGTFQLVRRFYDGIWDRRQTRANDKIAQMAGEFMLGKRDAKTVRMYRRDTFCLKTLTTERSG